MWTERCDEFYRDRNSGDHRSRTGCSNIDWIGISLSNPWQGKSSTEGWRHRRGSSSFATINVPGAIFTVANGINNSGQIVGQYGNATGPYQGFLATPTVVPEPSALPLLADV
jgi:hypothetical protein